MASVEDRWHSLKSARENPERCTKCTESKSATLYTTSVHGTGKRYAVRWWEGSRQRRKSFTLKGDADRFARKTTTDLERGHYIAPNAGKKPLREVCEMWLASTDHRDSTAEHARRHFRRHIWPYLGDRPIGGLQRSDVRSWMKGRRRDLSDATVAVAYGRLRAVLQFAVDEDMIPKTPCRGIKGPRVTRQEITPLSRQGVEALVAAAPPRYQAALLLAAGSGLRGGELLGLEVKHLDLDRGEVKVAQQLIEPDAGRPYIARPKTEQSYRTVPLAKTVVEALEGHLRRFPPVDVDVEDRSDPRAPRVRTARLVFPNGNGNPVRRAGWSKILANAVRRAGSEVPEGTTAHDLPLLREPADLPPGVGEGRPAATGTRQGVDHARRVHAPLRGGRGHHAGRGAGCPRRYPDRCSRMNTVRRVSPECPRDAVKRDLPGQTRERTGTVASG